MIPKLNPIKTASLRETVKRKNKLIYIKIILTIHVIEIMAFNFWSFH
jgi:hypothetical protein